MSHASVIQPAPFATEAPSAGVYQEDQANHSPKSSHMGPIASMRDKKHKEVTAKVRCIRYQLSVKTHFKVSFVCFTVALGVTPKAISLPPAAFNSASPTQLITLFCAFRWLASTQTFTSRQLLIMRKTSRAARLGPTMATLSLASQEAVYVSARLLLKTGFLALGRCV